VGHESHAKWFHEPIPNSDLRLASRAGHMFHYAVPDQVADAIVALPNRRRMISGPGQRRPGDPQHLTAGAKSRIHSAAMAR
jgi:hypothetical protein